MILSYIYSALILITIFNSMIYRNLSAITEQKSKKFLSILKLFQFFKEQCWVMVLIGQKHFFNTALNQINYHCLYEKRPDRASYSEILAGLS